MMKFVVLCALVAGAIAAPSSQDYQPSLFEEAYDVYSSCSGQDLTVCLKLKALGMMDRVARSAEINVLDGVKIVKTDDAKASRAEHARSLSDIESTLPVENEAREAAIDEAIAERTSRFLSTHVVELKAPEESGRSLDEGRAKKKKIQKLALPLLFLLKLKALTLGPILIGGLALLALKALVVGKIALIISAILAVQKLIGSGAGKTQVFETHHPTGHEDHHDHHGWARAYAVQRPTL